MNETTLTIQQVRALILASAKKDVRYYLNGFLVDFGRGHAVATDGRVLLAVNIDATDTENKPFGPAVIVDREAAETIAKGGRKTDTVTITVDHSRHDSISLARSNGMTITLAPIDGKFPDYDRVIPGKAPNVPAPSLEPAQFDYNLVARLGKALNLAADSSEFPYLLHNGTSAGVMAVPGQESAAVGVIMPCRIDTPENTGYAVDAFYGFAREAQAA